MRTGEAGLGAHTTRSQVRPDLSLAQRGRVTPSGTRPWTGLGLSVSPRDP